MVQFADIYVASGVQYVLISCFGPEMLFLQGVYSCVMREFCFQSAVHMAFI